MLQSISDLIRHSEVLSLISLAILLNCAGRLALSNHDSMRNWGKRFAFASFFLQFVTFSLSDGLMDAWELFGNGFRAGLGAFIGLGLAWCVLAISLLFWQMVVRPIYRLSDQIKQRKTKYRLLAEQHQSKQIAQQKSREDAKRQHNVNETKCRKDIQKRADNQQREDTRFACQIFYDQHADDLEALFPRTRLEEYFAMYLSDERSVEQVKVRGDQLQQLLKDLLARNGSSNNQQTSILDIRQRFDEQRKAISDADLDAESAQSLLSDIAREEQRVIREFHQR